MATSASSVIEISIAATTGNTLAGNPFTGTGRLSQTQTLTTADISKVYIGTGTISGVSTINVTSLTDAYGNSISFATVKGCVIQNSGAGNLVVGGGTHPLFSTDQYTIASGATLPITSAFTVSSGTHDTITLTPSASLTYSIIIVGS